MTTIAPDTQTAQATYPGELILDHNEIIKLLPVFKPECVFIRRARIQDRTLHCSFSTFEYPFSVQSIKHLTREHALVFVTQACYLLSALLSRIDNQWPIDTATTLALAVNEQMLFSDIHLHFVCLIPNRDGIDLQLTLADFRIIRERIFAKLEFKFPEGCFGHCQAVIALDSSFELSTRLTKVNAPIK